MAELRPPARPKHSIPALVPGGEGHQFVLYGDSCSGIPGGAHEEAFARVNAVVRRLVPEPEFLLFTGDEIAGLTADAQELRAQWQHWLTNEMGWLARGVPLWHATGNHTTYDAMSEGIFRNVLKLPCNGPIGQEGLSYFIRRGSLLIVFVHTLCSDLGGEGYVETRWLREVLGKHADAGDRLVVGHHPVFPVNGYSGPYQRQVAPEVAGDFWDALVDGGVRAYLCSHILAFDVQVHRGVLQICSAGAGNTGHMPEGEEYLHCVQMVLDDAGLSYQVLDAAGRVRERLTWPVADADAGGWIALAPGDDRAPWRFPEGCQHGLALRFRAQAAARGTSAVQTLLAMRRSGERESLWIGVRGAEQRVTVIVAGAPGRSPHYWLGPRLQAAAPFDFRLLLHPDMGPGGILFGGDDGWDSLAAASPWGLERLRSADAWSVGHGWRGSDHDRFRGQGLAVFAARLRQAGFA